MKRITFITVSILLVLNLSAQINFNNNTVSNENYSSALGENNISTGLSSFACGKNDTVTGSYSFTGGINSSANGSVSFAFGSNAMANYDCSISLGTMTTSDNNQAFAIGSFCKASGTKSFVLGNGIRSSTQLHNPIANSMMIGVNSDRPTLFVGNSGGIGLSGKIGIGDITDPESKLHIKADDNELAEIFIQPHTWGGDNTAFLWLGTKEYGLKAAYNRLEFKTSTGGKYTFNDGNVGIGTYNPSEKLEVAGKIKTTGFQLVDGLQGEGKYLKSDAEGNASWEASTISNSECLASGLYSSAIGRWDTASSDCSFAGGYNSNADGALSFAYGATANAYGSHSFALGGQTTAEGTCSFAMGNRCKVTGQNSFVIGSGSSSSEILTNSVDNSLMIGFNGFPTFFVSPSYGGHSGNVGIGNITAPLAKLHVKGDMNDQTVVFIEPYAFGGSYVSELWIGTPDYGLKATYGRLHFKTGGNYIFNSPDANVGIGNINPLAKLQVNGDIFIEDDNSGLILKSPDGQCWKITVGNDGELTTTSINCDLTTGVSNAIKPIKENIRIYPNPATNEVTIENHFSLPVHATVRDLNSALILALDLFSGINKISLENLVTGYYLITISDDNDHVVSTEKVMKK
ncbi:MAG: T9SS type A sorting domain-containing protein [Bacteroidetes bacterium]|nr:T9SS type A sorting domain-containing protein [Bacteroidota bacterium]